MAIPAAAGNFSSPVNTQMEIIKSRSVLGAAVDKRDLVVNAVPDYFPIIGRAWSARAGGPASAPEAGPEQETPWLGRYAWGPASLKVARLSLPPALLGRTLTLRALGGDAYVLLDPDGTQILRGQVGTPSSSQLANGEEVHIFVRELVAASPPTDFNLSKRPRLPVISSLRSRLTVEEQGEYSGILNISLDGPDPEAITATVNAVAAVYLRQNVEARSQQAQQSLDFLEQQLPKIKADLETAETQLTEFREAHQAVALDAQAGALLQQMVALEQQRSQLTLKRAELRETYTSEHPAMVALREKLASIEAQREQLLAEIGTSPRSQKKMLGLMRAVEVNTALYTTLLNRAQELRLVKAGTTGNVRIIDRAVAPLPPVSPQRNFVLAVMLILGLMLGCAVVFLRAALRRGIDDPQEIEKTLGLLVYAVIPHSGWLARRSRKAKRQRKPAPLLARDQPDEAATEALRSLRTSIYFAQGESRRNLLLVTGPGAGVGKSFVSLNLAYLLADVGKRVVVIDADMRRGRLHEFLDNEREPGLSQVLTGQVPLDQALRTLNGGDVQIITSGTVPPNPSELLMRESFPRMLSELEQQFDLVIIDAPPALAVTDASIIASSVPGIVTFIVARAGRHPPAELQETLKRLTRNDSKVAGVVFNGLKKENAAYAGYGYYQYEYKSQQ